MSENVGTPGSEEALLRSVALQNANSILLARRRAEDELIRAKEALECKTEELAHSLAVMRATLESTTDAILVTDGRGQVNAYNQKLVDMWQLPSELLQYKDHHRVLDVTERLFKNPLGFRARIAEIYATSPPETYDLLHLADGRVFERFSSIQQVDGKNVGRVWSFRDVTERIRASSELEAARDQALAGSRAKSTLLANMSHELRTPLNAIIGYAEMLQEEVRAAGSEAMSGDLGKIEQAGRHLLSLINDILDLSKIEAGKMEVSVIEFEVSTLIDEVGNMVAPLIVRNGNELVVEVAPKIGTMTSDEVKVRQVLYNLLSNASKFTENGRISLIVRRTTDAESDRIIFRVADTGMGMAPEETALLFQDFAQLDSSATRKHGGSGLGLSISRRFCNMMGGDVTVESEKDRGSVFTVSLPAMAPRRYKAP